MEVVRQKVLIYTNQDGHQPYVDWFDSCADKNARNTIKLRITQLRKGNFGHSKSLKKGLFEIKIDSGPGYRIYFVKVDNKTVLLLRGGTKKTQGSRY